MNLQARIATHGADGKDVVARICRGKRGLRGRHQIQESYSIEWKNAQDAHKSGPPQLTLLQGGVGDEQTAAETCGRVLHNECKIQNTRVVQRVSRQHTFLLSVPHSRVSRASRRRKPRLVEMANGIGLIHQGSQTCLMYLKCRRLKMRVSILWAPFACGAPTAALLCRGAAPTDRRGGSGFVGAGSGADTHGDVDAGTDASVASSGGSGSRLEGDSDGGSTTGPGGFDWTAPGNTGSSHPAGGGTSAAGGPSPSAKVLRKVSATCPAMQIGTAMFMGQPWQLWVGSAGDGPIIIYWHGTGSSLIEPTYVLGHHTIDAVVGEGRIVAAPGPSGNGSTGKGTNTGDNVWYTGDFDMADQVGACDRSASYRYAAHLRVVRQRRRPTVGLVGLRALGIHGSGRSSIRWIDRHHSILAGSHDAAAGSHERAVRGRDARGRGQGCRGRRFRRGKTVSMRCP